MSSLADIPAPDPSDAYSLVTALSGYPRVPQQHYAVGDGVTDDTAALVLWLADVQASGYGYLPPGRYRANGALALDLAMAAHYGVTIAGAGAEATELYFPTAGGLSIARAGDHSRFSLRDLTITTGQAGGGTALTVTQAAAANPALSAVSDLTNVMIRGSDGYAVTNFWTTGVAVTGGSIVRYQNCAIYGSATRQGVGVALSGADASHATCVHNLAGVQLVQLDAGLTYGTWVQGVTIAGTNFTGCTRGILVNAVSGASELLVADCQFDIRGGVDIDIAGELEFLKVSGSLFSAQGGTGAAQPQIRINGAVGHVAISACMFDGQAERSHGVHVLANDALAPGIISGNSFANFTTAGIQLDAGTSALWVAAPNSYAGTGLVDLR